MQMNKTLKEWLAHIKMIHDKRIDLGLSRILTVANRLNIGKFHCPVIMVGGTNGKGSCVKTLESIYTESGFSTGVYTSPHLITFNERVRIDNQTVSDAALVSAFLRVESAREETILSFFEFTTLAAFCLFQQARCDVLILEVGLGGRLDAVNIIDSDVAVITSIALDHMDWLGDNRDAIAIEKAGIARSGKPLICGDPNPPDTLFEAVKKHGAMLYRLGRDYDYEMINKQMTWKSMQPGSLTLPLPILKPQNIATALMAVTCLQKELSVSKEAIGKGIEKASLPGRFEVCNFPLPCVLDVAHNPQSAHWLAVQYAGLPKVGRTVALVGMLKDKAMTETVAKLLPEVSDWLIAELLVERGSDGSEIKQFLATQGINNCYNFACVSDALDSIMEGYQAGKWDRALVFGSFQTIADATKWIDKRRGDQWKLKSNND